MKEVRDRFPLLRQLFGGYFHQDWMVVHESEDDAIHSFVLDDGSADAYRAINELDDFLALGLPDETLNRVMSEDMSCEYDPEPDGHTMTDWLRWVRDTLAKYAAEKAKQEKGEAARLKGPGST